MHRIHLLTHPIDNSINTNYQHTLSAYPINTPYQLTPSIVLFTPIHPLYRPLLFVLIEAFAEHRAAAQTIAVCAAIAAVQVDRGEQMRSTNHHCTLSVGTCTYIRSIHTYPLNAFLFMHPPLQLPTETVIEKTYAEANTPSKLIPHINTHSFATFHPLFQSFTLFHHHFTPSLFRVGP